LGSRAGNTAYVKACSPLDTKWDGSIDKFPSLITGLRDRAIEAKWDAVAPHGIITFTIGATDFNLLTQYHSISLTEIESARTLVVTIAPSRIPRLSTIASDQLWRATSKPPSSTKLATKPPTKMVPNSSRPLPTSRLPPLFN
jgi:hypothetical protein